jgi:hypothetical protein
LLSRYLGGPDEPSLLLYPGSHRCSRQATVWWKPPLLTPAGGHWKLNLRDGECIRIRLARRDRLGRPDRWTR